jgi:hypothetical protein
MAERGLAGHRDEAWRHRRSRAPSPRETQPRIQDAPTAGTAWLALPERGLTVDAALLQLIADEINVKQVIVIDDDSALVERRVKPLLPKIGKRLGASIPAVMAAARAGEVTFHEDGSVTLAGVTLAPDEVEIQATPRPGTAVAHHDGLVVVLDTALTPGLVAEGDARELARAIQDLRREAALALDDRIDLWIERLPPAVIALLPAVAADTLAELGDGEIPPDASRATVELDGGSVAIALRRRPTGVREAR